MIKRAFTPGQIINNLREVEILLSQGATTGEASRKVGITEKRITVGVGNTVVCV